MYWKPSTYRGYYNIERACTLYISYSGHPTSHCRWEIAALTLVKSQRGYVTREAEDKLTGAELLECFFFFFLLVEFWRQGSEGCIREHSRPGEPHQQGTSLEKRKASVGMQTGPPEGAGACGGSLGWTLGWGADHTDCWVTLALAPLIFWTRFFFLWRRWR